MQAVLDLMHDFIEDRLDVEGFISQFMDLWRQLRDEQDTAINAQGLRADLDALAQKLTKGELNTETYHHQWQVLVNKVEGVTVPIGSSIDQILSHLFVEAGAYVADPELREPYEIDEVQLRTEVKKSYTEMMNIL